MRSLESLFFILYLVMSWMDFFSLISITFQGISVMKLPIGIFIALAGVLVLLGIGLFIGCNEDSSTPTQPPPSGNDLSVDNLSPVLTIGSASTLTISGGTPPYVFQTGIDTAVATATMSGSTIHVTGKASGYTYFIISDSVDSRLRVVVSVSGPIHFNIFPLAANENFSYTGFLVDTNTVETPRPGIPPGAYSASWTVLPGASSDNWIIQDSTTVGLNTSVHFFLIRKDTTTGDFDFLQTLGPFYRKFGVVFTDSTVWIHIAKPSVGIGGQWTAFDTTVSASVAGQTANVRLQILGSLSGAIITDSSAAHNVYASYFVRTWRKISISGFVVQDDATTARLWLVKNIGAVQVNIAGDTENFGHFRILRSKNF